LGVEQGDGWDAVPPLVGREAEVAVLDRVLAASGRRRPALVHVVGEPGLGKTRLLGEACDRAAALGMLVLTGVGEGRRSGRLFGAIAEPFGRYAADAAADGRRTPGLDDPDLAMLAALADDSGGSTGDVGARVVADAVRRALTEMARSRPVLVSLDDVQWSDEGSLDVLTSLSRHPPRAGVVIVLGYRPLPGLGTFADVRPGRIEGPVVGSLHRFDLAALSEPQLAEMFPDATPARRRALYEACGGNPFYLQAVNAAGADIVVGEPAQGADSLPSAVRNALSAELDTLDVDTRHIADTAAVVGGLLDPDLLARVADRPMSDVLDALDVMSARTICRPVAPGRWQFRHPMLARVAYHAQPTASRFRAHHAAAAELARHKAPLAERARHLAVASSRGDAESARTIASAADQLAGQAPAQAARWYAVALDIAPQADPRWLETLKLARARALASLGRLEEARVILHDFLADCPGDDPERIAATALAARVEYLLGQHHEAEALLQRELLSQVRWKPEALAAVHVELATARLMKADFGGAREAAELALQLAPGSEQLTVAGAASTIALSGAASGDFDLALRQREIAAQLVDGLSDGELAAALEVGVWLGWAEMFLEHPDAKRHLERCLRIARSGAHQHLLTHLLVGWGSVLKISGDLPGATEAFDEAHESAERVGSRELTTMAVAMQCRAATWRGDTKAAERLGAAAVALTEERSNWFASVAAALLAQARLAAGDHAGCADAILKAGGGPDLPGFDPVSRCDWWEVAVTAAILDGDLARASEFSSRSRACAEALPLQGPRGFALLAESRILLARGEPGKAAISAAEAKGHFAAIGQRLETARATYLEGLARGELGNRRDALELLSEAETVFAACRAARLRAETRVALRRFGRRVSAVADGSSVRRTGDAAMAVLSARERQVADLVAQGNTNRQIAAALVMSEKTVESHLGHIFVKLGVTSRASVAAMAAQDSSAPVR
jgi:DNA-binding CsgD family transcriptional regulator